MRKRAVPDQTEALGDVWMDEAAAFFFGGAVAGKNRDGRKGL